MLTCDFLKRITGGVLTAAAMLLVIPTVMAQPLDGVPYEGSQPGFSSGGGFLGSSPFRLWLQSGRPGQDEADIGIGMRGDAELNNGLLFLDAQYRLNGEDRGGVNIGGGLRQFSSLGGVGVSPRILGTSFWYDGQTTTNDNYFNQVGVSIESLGEIFDFRANANIPFEDEQLGNNTIVTDNPAFFGNLLGRGTLTPTDVSLRVIELEAAVRVMRTNSWVYGAAYQMDGNGVSDLGYKAGIRGYLINDLVLELGASDDDTFGTSANVGLVWFPGRTPNGTGHGSHTIYDRMREPVYRNNYVATTQILTAGVDAFTDAQGDTIRVVHVDSGAGGGGDGSFESPLSSIDDVFGSSQEGDLVVVHSGSVFEGQSIQLRDEQRLLGEGGDEMHIVTTSELGDVELPETSTGSRSGAVPIIRNAPGDAIVLSPTTADGSTVTPIEVSNLVIDGGTRGVAAPNGVGEADLNRLTISDTTGNGIDLMPLIETLDDDSTQARFNPTISQVSFDNVGGDDIRLAAGEGVETGMPVLENIAISDVTSTNGNGQGINLSNNTSDVTISDYTLDGGTSALGGIRITEAGGNVTVTNASISNVSGAGVAFLDSAGDHILTDVTIFDATNDDTPPPTSAAFLVSGGTANVDFTGQITQNTSGAAFLADDGHSGTITLNEMTEDEGVVIATNGTGLQFNSADGTYVFENSVFLAGGAAGIDVTGASSANITIRNADIMNPNDIAIHIAGTSAAEPSTASMTFTGNITQTANNHAVLSVSDHTGTLAFNKRADDAAVIEASAGSGLQFSNADGAYTFNDEVELAGGNAGIDVLNDSDGTFAFDGGSIQSPTGPAINIVGGSSIMTYAGQITKDNAGAAISVSGGHAGTLIVTEGVAGEGSLNVTSGTGLLFDNADGDYSFNNGVRLIGTDTAIQIVNGSTGTMTFNDTTISGTTNSAVAIEGGSANLNFTGDITHTSNTAVVRVSDGHTGSVVFNENTDGDNVINASNGTGLQFNNADGTYTFNGTNQLTNSNVGIDVLNGSAGTFTFSSDTSISNPSGVAARLQGSSADFNYNGTIQNNSNFAVAIEQNTGGDIVFGGTITDTDRGVLIEDNSNVNITFLDTVDLNTGAFDALTIQNNTSTTTLFNDLQIETTSGTGFQATNAGNITVAGSTSTITSTTGRAVNWDTVTIGPAGANFRSISTNGADSGIVLRDISGGSFNVGVSGNNLGDGGTIQNTTGDGIILVNVANASFNNMIINGSAGNGVLGSNTGSTSSNVVVADSTIRNTGAVGLFMNVTGSGAMRLTANDNAIDNTAGEGMRVSVDGNATLANVSLSGNTVVNTSNNEALRVTGSGNTAKRINFLAQDNQFSNNSTTADAASLQANGAVNLNATFLDNVFTNSNVTAGRPFEVTANDGAANVRLSMFGNTSTAGDGGDDYFLIQNSGSFSVENLTVPAVPVGEVPEQTVEEANSGTFFFNGTITTDPGNIPRP
ncbi:MAG: right-handed parallel beta-helix repeat-containing protein [Planctomycetales bacterium]|nr:right-handed parallel beta-helix repeat-containing protein [Planctomycetales bacterium]